MCFLLVSCSLYNLFFREYLGDIQITFYLKDLPAEIKYNQAHVPLDQLEYYWGAHIDIDDDPGTGDTDGFDVKLSFVIGKTERGPYVANMNKASGWMYIWDSGTGGYTRFNPQGERLNEPADHVDATDNIIILGAFSRWEELAGLNASSRFQFETMYYAESGQVYDSTSIIVGSGTVIDTEGDVAYSFIDLLGAKVEY